MLNNRINTFIMRTAKCEEISRRIEKVLIENLNICRLRRLLKKDCNRYGHDFN